MENFSHIFDELDGARGIAASQVMIGVLMAKLVENGLRKCQIDPLELFPDEKFNAVRHDPFNTEGREENVELPPDLLELQLLCSDTMDWLLKEGIARADGQTDVMSGHSYFGGVHLTSKGIELAQRNDIDLLGGRSAEETLEEKPHNSGTYQKLGAFVGAALAGFTKGIS